MLGERAQVTYLCLSNVVEGLGCMRVRKYLCMKLTSYWREVAGMLLKYGIYLFELYIVLYKFAKYIA